LRLRRRRALRLEYGAGPVNDPGTHRSRALPCLDDDQGHAVDIFDDTPPTVDELRTLGLSVSHLHQPDVLRSYEDDGEIDPGDAPDSSWTMSW
jgi:hypothetical protein